MPQLQGMNPPSQVPVLVLILIAPHQVTALLRIPLGHSNCYGNENGYSVAFCGISTTCPLS
jgi:hypothetical protein